MFFMELLIEIVMPFARVHLQWMGTLFCKWIYTISIIYFVLFLVLLNFKIFLIIYFVLILEYIFYFVLFLVLLRFKTLYLFCVIFGIVEI